VDHLLSITGVEYKWWIHLMLYKVNCIPFYL